MIEIRRINPDEVTSAKRVIYRVAHEIFNDPLPLEESIPYLESRGELKRLWLLTSYHGKGLGYRMIQELFSFARQREYRRIWLQTHAVHQSRALNFYNHIGFYEIPRYTDHTDDIAMEMCL